MFKFTVGQNVDGELTTFSVHEEAIAALSQPLHTLMRSGLSESETGHAIWEDVSKDTFVRFAQFAYTGDYSVPALATRETAVLDGEKIADAEQIAVAIPAYVYVSEDEVEPFGGGYGEKPEKKKKGKKGLVKEESPPDTAWVRFQEAITEFPTFRKNSVYQYDPPSSFEPDKSYSSAFIGHASLWVMGNYRLVDSLKILALYKLHSTLAIFRITEKNVGDVVDLVRYAYSEEGAGIEEGTSGLRNLVCLFLVIHQRALCQDDGFMDLLGEGGQFVKDFFKYSTV
ncbi:hypothetical protein IFR05_002855 [Cadophora sp. M221]|nr:hypothetical protein IFR05_002855 [Cadophora sp. M221]